MYSFCFQIYVWLFHLTALFHPKARKMVEGQRETFARLEKLHAAGGEYVWFHAASLGEFEQGRPLIEAIRKEHPEQKILVSFYSPSGYEVRQDYREADMVCYLPFDLKRNVRRFLDLLQPKAVFFIKYEFWPNYLNALHRRGVPVFLISGIFRPTQTFFKPWGGFYRYLLGLFSQFFVQNRESEELLGKVGLADRVLMTGDTRCDRVLQVAAQKKEIIGMDDFLPEDKGTPVLVAGSTWPRDEELLIPWFNAHPEVKLILAPHQVNENHLAYIESLLERPFVRYSQLSQSSEGQADCLIIDCYGLLSSLYGYGTMAYVGGGFGVGIHNTLEAAVYQIPVVFGPNYQKFDEAKAMLSRGGAFSIGDGGQLASLLDDWLANPEKCRQAGQAAGDYVQQNSGSTERILAALSQKP
ncbi:MAG: 3-deoxy-D-manno-octulosonic acid transferase [Bacteroidales bacterium]|nr:3-deoxy-D-manno-octulosonic acid transferase [Bacteroidales bacterium]